VAAASELCTTDSVGEASLLVLVSLPAMATVGCAAVAGTIGAALMSPAAAAGEAAGRTMTRTGAL
jgi:hypothetical protein